MKTEMNLKISEMNDKLENLLIKTAEPNISESSIFDRLLPK